MPKPTTPAPMMATCGFLPIWGSFCVRGGSLRWNDPDRFDGFDLSRPPREGRHPRPKQRDNGGFSALRQGRGQAADAAANPAPTTQTMRITLAPNSEDEDNAQYARRGRERTT